MNSSRGEKDIVFVFVFAKELLHQKVEEEVHQHNHGIKNMSFNTRGCKVIV